MKSIITKKRPNNRKKKTVTPVGPTLSGLVLNSIMIISAMMPSANEDEIKACFFMIVISIQKAKAANPPVIY